MDMRVPFEGNNRGPVVIFDKEKTITEIDALRNEANEIMAQIHSLMGVAEEVKKSTGSTHDGEAPGKATTEDEADSVLRSMQEEVSPLAVKLKETLLKLTEMSTSAKVSGLSIPEVNDVIQKMRTTLDSVAQINGIN